MRLSFSGRVAAALMLLALGGYATAQERLTLRIADQKAACVRSWRRPTPCKISLTTLSGPSSGRRAAGGSPQRGRRGRGDHWRCAVALRANGAPVKAIAVDKSNPAGTAVLVSPAAR